jgi:hypothetical protein
VHGPIKMRFDDEVVVTVPHIRLINSTHSIAIAGVNLLCGGRPFYKYNFHSLPVTTHSDGTVTGTIAF